MNIHVATVVAQNYKGTDLYFIIINYDIFMDMDLDQSVEVYYMQ